MVTILQDPGLEKIRRLEKVILGVMVLMPLAQLTQIWNFQLATWILFVSLFILLDVLNLHRGYTHCGTLTFAITAINPWTGNHMAVTLLAFLPIMLYIYIIRTFPLQSPRPFLDAFKMIGYHDWECNIPSHDKTNHQDVHMMVGCYYPTEVPIHGASNFPDVPLMINGKSDVKGISSLNGTPTSVLMWLKRVGCGVLKGAPISFRNPATDKYIPVIFSHGNGMSRTLYSNVCRSMASSKSKIVVFSIGHGDRSACSHAVPHQEAVVYEPHTSAHIKAGLDFKTFKSKQAKIRVEETLSLIDHLNIFKGEVLPGLTTDQLDMTKLTIAGQSFGCSTSVSCCKADDRIKNCILLDPWLRVNSDNGDLDTPLDQNTLVVATEFFNQNFTPYGYNNFDYVRKTLDFKNKEEQYRLFVMGGASHISQCDLTGLLGHEYHRISFRKYVSKIQNEDDAQYFSNHLVVAFMNAITKDKPWSEFDKNVLLPMESKIENLSDLCNEDLEFKLNSYLDQ